MKTPKPKTGHLQVYDLEKNKWLECTPEQQQLAAYVHQQILIGTFISAIAIKKVFDEKLYFALGCNSRDEYIETMLPIGRRQAYRYYAIATKFDSTFKSLTGKGLMQIGQGDDLVSPGTLNGEIESGTQEMGVKKLYELTRLDDKSFEKLMKKEKVMIGDEEVDLNDIKGMTTKELNFKVSEALAPYKHKLKKANDKSAVLEEENKKLKAEMAANAKKLEHAVELEIQFGGVATKLDHKYFLLDRAKKLLDDFNIVMHQIGVTPDDPERLREEFVATIRKMDEYYDRVRDNHQDVTVLQ